MEKIKLSREQFDFISKSESDIKLYQIQTQYFNELIKSKIEGSNQLLSALGAADSGYKIVSDDSGYYLEKIDAEILG